MTEFIDCYKCSTKTPLEDTIPWGRQRICQPCQRAYNREKQQRYRQRQRPADYVAPPRFREDLRVDEAGRACSRCEIYKLWPEFYEDRSSRTGRDAICKECRRADRRARWAENRNGHRDKDIARRENWTVEERTAWRRGQFIYRLRSKFGITLAEYEQLEKEQESRCALCKDPEDKIHHNGGEVQRLAVDHDHSHCGPKKACSECIRGLLCARCNRILGEIEGYAELEKRFEDYLSRRPLSQGEQV